MFQYAVARKLALKFNTHVLLDPVAFDLHKLRKYSLSHFSFMQRIITDKERAFFGVKQAKLSTSLYLKISRKLLMPIVYSERQFNFDSNIFRKAKRNTYLKGYWQTEKYFSDIRKILLSDFSIRNPLEGRNLQLANQIEYVNSVSVHIRRGDYVTDAKTNNYHGLCGLDYYTKAIEYISKRVKDPVLFVFSDDIPWAKDNLNSSFEICFVDANNEDTAYEDMRLMSLCKHNIIANSSFSWWGAWLNKNTKKIVLAPDRWFRDTSIDTADLIPSTWIRM